MRQVYPCSLTDHVRHVTLVFTTLVLLLFCLDIVSSGIHQMVPDSGSTNVHPVSSLSHFSEELDISRMKRQMPLSFIVRDYGNCLSQPSCGDLQNITSQAFGQENVYFAATRDQILKIRLDTDASALCVCTVVYNSTDTVLSITADDSYVYWLDSGRTRLTYFSMDENQPHVPEVLELSQETLAHDKKHVQAACRIPTYIPNVPDATVISGTYLEFDLTEINATQYEWFNSPVCVHEQNPEIFYAFLYSKQPSISSNGGIRGMCNNASDCVYKRVDTGSGTGKVRLDMLTPNSAYSVRLVIYCEGQKAAVITSERLMKTSCGVSSAVQNLQCSGISDEEFRVSWAPPAVINSEYIRYEVYRDVTTLVDNITASKRHEESLVYRGSQGITYSFTVKTFAANCPLFEGQFNASVVTGCRPFLPPSKPIVYEVTRSRAVLRWDAPIDNSVQHVIIEWTQLEDFQQRKSTARSWSRSELLSGNESLIYSVTDLMADSAYSFRTYQQYVGYSGNEGWRYSEEVNTQTLPGVPDYPEDVRVETVMDDSYLTWTAPGSNGAELQYFEIAYRNRTSPNATRILFGTWVVGINISAKFDRWKIENLVENVWYEFRVSAVNSVGLGDTSLPSAPFLYAMQEETPVDRTIWFVGVSAGLLVVVVIVTFLLARRCCWKRETTHHHQTPTSSEITTIHLSYGTDLQLAQIRHMAEIATWKGIPNIPQDYMDLLPLFPREKLTLTDFLGKGAFGEVYRGVASDVDGGTLEKKVAVKTLREESTDSEKCEFLMEAYFMSNFDHENILSLLGVCLDNEPQYLILELMEGGDLLRYLREARPNPIMGPKLTTDDLLDICLDVAAGCKYLEEQRFIHRDLAARNCLVSTKAYRTESRVVKIGDFGLARDIYRNDYYHKVGEGLLPVRWMAPESLVDNLYTTQSDVWSFGVLLWEIMTFGQQPYPARTNLEVLQLVRAGGRLEKPEHCPEDIHALMLKCWHGIPTLRPSFCWALEWLQEFKRRNLVTLNDDYAIELSDVNYTTVTTSEEDMVEPEPPAAPNLARSPEHRFTAAVLGIENNAFEQDSSPRHFRFPPGADQGRTTPTRRHMRQVQPRNRLREAQQRDNGNSYLRISMDPSFDHLPETALSGSGDEEDEVMEMSDQPPDDALNYSVLGFPPSRNPSTRSATTPKEPRQTRFSLPSVDEAFAMSTIKDYSLLPYKGDLPITDEERLMRKQHWTQRNKIRSEDLEGPSTDSVPERRQVSPYLRGSMLQTNREYVNDDGSQPSTSQSFHSQSDSSVTHPKQTYDLEGNVLNPADLSDGEYTDCRTIHITLKDDDAEGDGVMMLRTNAHNTEDEIINKQTESDQGRDTLSNFSEESLIEELTRHWDGETNVAFLSSSPSPDPSGSVDSAGLETEDEASGEVFSDGDSSDEEVNYAKVTMNMPTYV